jgi:hypothetical protein
MYFWMLNPMALSNLSQLSYLSWFSQVRPFHWWTEMDFFQSSLNTKWGQSHEPKYKAVQEMINGCIFECSIQWLFQTCHSYRIYHGLVRYDRFTGGLRWISFKVHSILNEVNLMNQNIRQYRRWSMDVFLNALTYCYFKLVTAIVFITV